MNPINTKMKTLPRPVELICSCCRVATTGRQWHRQPPGFGLCPDCVKISTMGNTAEMMRAAYGVRGIHYDLDAMHQERLATAAGNFYAARDTVLVLVGEAHFRQMVDEFRPILADVCREQELSEMEATLFLLGMNAHFKGATDIDTLLCVAVCTEIMEPSLPVLH